jgi:hypothetical protein
MTSYPPKSPKSRQPRRGWSGITVLPSGDQAFDKVLKLLPSKKSASEALVAQLANLKARIHGWLHQDEFGPSRGEQTAAMRALMQSSRTLCGLLQKPASNARTLLDAAIRNRGDGLHSCLQAVEAAATQVETEFRTKGLSRTDTDWLSSVRQSAATILLQIGTLDDNTGDKIAWTALVRGFDLAQVVTSENFGFAQVEAWLSRYQSILFETLNGLNDQRGGEERVTLKLLVEMLCNLYEYETGMPVTAHAMQRDKYTAQVETDAGRFVTAAVEALLPDQAWFEQRADFGNSTRARTFLAGRQVDRARQILGIMRDFVARRVKLVDSLKP